MESNRKSYCNHRNPQFPEALRDVCDKRLPEVEKRMEKTRFCNVVNGSLEFSSLLDVTEVKDAPGHVDK